MLDRNELLEDMLDGIPSVSTKYYYMFWEQHYRNISEADAESTYVALKKEYFELANELWKQLERDPGKSLDDNFIKKYTIQQRKIGVRMIIVARDTAYEEEAKTFEAQTKNTDAGNAAASRIADEFALRIKRQQSTEGRERRSGEDWEDLKRRRRESQKQWWENLRKRERAMKATSTFGEWLKTIRNDEDFQKGMLRNIFKEMVSELVVFLTVAALKALSARGATIDPKISKIISELIGKPVNVKILKGDREDAFGYLDSIILTRKIVKKLTEDELKAVCLYCYAINKISAKEVFVKQLIKVIISSSLDVVIAYFTTKRDVEERVFIIPDPSEYFYNEGGFKSMAILIFSVAVGMDRKIKKALEFVKRKGFYRDLKNAQRKLLDRGRSSLSPSPREINKAAKYFQELLRVIKINRQVEGGKITSIISFFKKIIGIFKK